MMMEYNAQELIKVLRDAHQDVPPELERYAFSGMGGSGRPMRRYGRGNGMTGSNNVPIGRGYQYLQKLFVPRV